MADSVYYYAQEKRLSERFSDMLYPKETVDGDEIALRIMRDAGLELVD